MRHQEDQHQQIQRQSSSSESDKEEPKQGNQETNSVMDRESILANLKKVRKYQNKVQRLRQKFQGLILQNTGTRETEKEASEGGATDLISILEGTGKSTQVSPRDGFELPVFTHVPSPAREKIGTIGYTDLSTMLLQEGCNFEDDELVQRKKPDGEVVWTTKKKYVPITSLKLWEKAFGIYSAILLRYHPRMAVPLRQYEYTIRQWSKVYPGINVYNYDRQFCRAMSENPSRHWDRVDQEIASIELPKNPTMATEDGGKKFQKEGEYKPKRKISIPCCQFNHGYCTYGSMCHFEHVCQACGKAGHGLKTCKGGKKPKMDGAVKADSKAG